MHSFGSIYKHLSKKIVCTIKVENVCSFSQRFKCLLSKCLSSFPHHLLSEYHLSLQDCSLALFQLEITVAILLYVTASCSRSPFSFDGRDQLSNVACCFTISASSHD